MSDFVFGGDATDIPPGTYPATVKSITAKESTAYGEFRAWDFTLASGSVVGGATSMASGSKSKGGKWAMAILGRKPDKGEAVTLVGRDCLVVVGLDAADWPKVTDVLPPLATGVAQEVPTTTETAAPAEVEDLP